MAITDFDNLFKSFANIKVAVIGDVMLDTYWWGKVDRISPEAPVPVVAVTSREERIGGAANVALNVKAMGATVHILSVIGADQDGKKLETLLAQNRIQTDYLVKSEKRLTTNKIRIISRNQQMMRLDAEMTSAINSDDENALMASVELYIKQEKPGIIILEDYNKGVLTETLISKVISLCKSQQILTAVDPKRKNFFAYQHADIFKPNLHEAKEGLNIISDEVSDELLTDIHAMLKEKLQHKVSFITLSEKGVFYQTGDEHAVIPTHIRSIADVSGAGDTVIAVASVVYAATKNVQLMAEMANIAGGLVCEEVGTVAINPKKLQEECKRLLN
ncbi:MAG TPA: PfkB family carbohydrate kinase [Ferruginibacter sp.]|nr:PfkB family carbohydrate kinase [Ferruginibacter sp.]